MLGQRLTGLSASKVVHGGDGAIELAGEFVEARRLRRVMRQEDGGETLVLLKRSVLSGGESVEHRKARVALQVIKTGERRTANTSGWLKAQTADHGIA